MNGDVDQQQEFTFIAGGKSNRTATLEDNMIVSYKTNHSMIQQQKHCTFIQLS